MVPLTTEIELPRVQRFVYDDEPEGCRMEFRLIYDGRLPSQKPGMARGSEKHQIRKVLHKQLAALWRENPALQRLDSMGMKKSLASEFSRDGFNFCPLISETCGGAFASLDILFLRRDHPGNLVQGQTGDIDNRIKVLFDALMIPSKNSDIGTTPDEDEDPFFTLLEDDKLITSFSVTTDRLLTPFAGSHTHPLNDVVLIINVKTGVFRASAQYAETFW
jgi:hypothetical protein